MASVSFFAQLIGTDLQPGASHNWEAWGFGGNSAVAVTAIPSRQEGGGTISRMLAVENVRVESRSGVISGPSLKVFCSVRNVGYNSVPSYALNFFAFSP